MSEEPEVSPLRLKRPGAGVPPPPPQASATPPAIDPVTPPPPPVASPAAPEPPLMPLPGMPTPPAASHDASSPERIRRRPSLVADTPAAPAPPASPAAHPEHVSPSAPAPAREAADVQPAPAAPPVFKLKVGAKPPPPPPPPSSAEPDPKAEALRVLEQPPSEAPLIPLPGIGPGAGAPSVLMGSSLPLPVPPIAPPSGLAPIAPGGPPPLSRALIHLRTEAPAEALDPSKLPPPLPAHAGQANASRNHARRDAMLFGLVLLFVVGAGAAAYFFLTKPDVAKETASSAREKIAEAAQLPGKAVNEARQSLAGAREKEQARVDAVASGKETPEARAIGDVTPGELQAKLREQNSAFPSPPAPTSANTASVPAAPGQPVTAYAGEKTEPVAPPAIPEPVQPSSRLLRYAEGIRVSGVFQGSPARALIDGRLVREGELAESTLGIKFAALDPQAKQLILEEPSGARVRVKY